jgi:hypothetical protein
MTGLLCLLRARSGQADEGQDGQYDDDEADEIDDAVHDDVPLFS